MSFNKLDIDRIEQVWQQAAESIGGTFKLSDFVKANTNGRTYLFGINAVHSGNHIYLKYSILDQVNLYAIKKPLEFTAKIDIDGMFELSTWQHDFFDRLLPSKRIKSGNIMLDKKVGISSSNKDAAKKLLSDATVQQLFLQLKANLVIGRIDSATEIKLFVFDDICQRADKIAGVFHSFVQIIEIIQKIH